ncbi:MAG: glycosyltransferase [Maritimibacter sp.]
MSNQQAYLRFKELLETRQSAHDLNRDIRAHVLSLTKKKIGFGYVRRTLASHFGSNLQKIFPNNVAADEKNLPDCDAYCALGTIYQDPGFSHPGAVKVYNAAPNDKEILLTEVCFLASTHSWSHSFRSNNPDYAALGYVYDDIAHYFMADYPNRIIQKLNSDEAFTDDEKERAQRLLARIVEQRISKYNAQPMHAPAMTEGFTRRVLVCDQAYADASTVYGKVGDAEFEKMLLAAISENPDAEILVKTHPDTVWEKEKRIGYYAHLQSTGRVRMLREPINPYTLFELVDTVYVGSSQMGLEALFAGKKVVTFGVPFYAGWGLTDDRQPVPHRHRTRSLLELFHYFYVWYSIYNLPTQEGVAEIEDVLDFIEKNRPYQLPLTQDEIEATPKVSVIIPVHGVEKYIEQCIASVQNQTLREIEIIPVNDVSPDGSQAIIDRLAAEDPRIRPIILKENVKQGMARNIGLEAARGEYVWLLDGDDWFSHNDMLRELCEQADQENTDMLRGRKACEAVFDQKDNLLSERQDETEIYFDQPIETGDFSTMPVLLHNRHCWTWLYRRSFLRENDIRFVTPQWEERAFLMRALVKAKSIGVSTTDGPVYRIRVDSTARRKRGPKDFAMMLTNFRSTFDSYIEEGALDQDSPLRYHLNFQLSQFVQHMFIGAPYAHYREAEAEAEAEFLSEIREQFTRCDFGPTDFVTDVHRLSESHLLAFAYPMIVAAVLANRPDILKMVVSLEAIPQAVLYEEFLKAPETKTEQDFQDALNRYARNDKVKPQAPVGTSSGQPRPRIIVHIGATKTGSTFLQHMLEKNRPALLREGVWFPEIGLFWQPNRPHKQAGHSDFTRAAVKRDQAVKNHILSGLELMEGRVHTIVLSSEAFFLQENPPRLADLFKGFPMEMVAYIRRQDEWANSQYCEFVAGGAVGRVDVPISEWLASPETQKKLNYRRPLESWGAKIGTENVHVRVFEKEKFEGGDLLSDFAHTTGLPMLVDMPRPSQQEQNEARLSAGHVELIRLFNTRPFDSREAYFGFIEDVGSALSEWRQSKGLPQSKPWLLSAEQADALMADQAENNSFIASTYLAAAKDAPLFGEGKAHPPQEAVYHEEISLVDAIYQKYVPQTQAQTTSKSKGATGKPQAAQLPGERIVNYGIFGWRLWLLAPIFAIVYSRVTSPERLIEFRKEPFDFSNKYWAGRRPFIAALLYPEGNLMGPFGVFRVWKPVARKLIALSGRDDLQKSFQDDPVRFARNINDLPKRIIGRLMFPSGERR